VDGILQLVLQPYLLLSLLVWVTYWEAQYCGFVSDDIEGIANYDGKMQVPISFGNILKKVRFEIGKVINPKRDEPNQRTFIASTIKHHTLSIFIFHAAILFLYSFLASILDPRLALIATALFTVHPLGVQAVVWCSGIGYITGLLFACMGLNLAYFLQNVPQPLSPTIYALGLILYGIVQYCAVSAHFTTSGVVLILAFLGYWPLVIISGLIAVYSMFVTFKEAVGMRKKTFAEQKMGYSTHFHLGKFFVIPKVLAYYVILMLFPKRMGLYHKYGYHYRMPETEMEDGLFWLLLIVYHTLAF